MDTGKLDIARQNIDRINSELVSLLIKRMQYVDQVAEYKAANNLPISVPEREIKILEQVSQQAGEEYAQDVIPVFRAIFSASCAREKRKIKN